MGTRNLTMVISEEKTKVAQYGQWDGYPSGVGRGILEFLQNVDLKEFKTKIDALEELTTEDTKELNKLIDKGEITLKGDLPEYSRDTADGILTLINEDKVWNNKVSLDADFIEDGLFCEWAYVIDLDKNKLFVKNGADAEYDLDNLPTLEELQALENQDDD